jgi:hypothetical protein
MSVVASLLVHFLWMRYISVQKYCIASIPSGILVARMEGLVEPLIFPRTAVWSFLLANALEKFAFGADEPRRAAKPSVCVFLTENRLDSRGIRSSETCFPFSDVRQPYSRQGWISTRTSL